MEGEEKQRSPCVDLRKGTWVQPTLKRNAGSRGTRPPLVHTGWREKDRANDTVWPDTIKELGPSSRNILSNSGGSNVELEPSHWFSIRGRDRVHHQCGHFSEAKDHFGLKWPLLSTTIRSYILKHHLKPQNRNLILTMLRGTADFSGLGGVWDWPSHSGNVYSRIPECHVIRTKDEKDHPDCYQQQVQKGPQDRGLSWYGVVSVNLVKVIYTLQKHGCTGLACLRPQ